VRTNYIFITGGVVSGLGKGITSASIGKILRSKNFNVTAVKVDPYINWDAGTLRPTEHGEVWVTEDGGEIDQDLGHYERFLDVILTKEHNITTGQVYGAVIERERRGEYLGKTVQPIPHITDEIKRRFKAVAEKTKAGFVIIEIGGVVGDYENILFLEAARQMKLEDGNVCFIHVTYLPVLENLGEMKSKPTQHSVKELRSFGIQPDFIVCRSDYPVDDVRKEKIALFCNVAKEYIISNPNIENIYELPLIFEEQKFGDKVLQKFNLKSESDMEEWKEYIGKIKNLKKSVKIGIVGKYFDIGAYKLPDSYVSVVEAVKHAAWNNGIIPQIEWIDSKDFEKDSKKLEELRQFDGVIVPGGFGASGVEGKILATQFVRENNIPFLGLCFGLQLAVVEYARNVCKLGGAHSTEINTKSPHPVIDLLPWQKKILEESKYGATMRLGGQIVEITPNTLAHKLYGKNKTIERFRHRYEINPEYVSILIKNGFVFSGKAEKEDIMQIGELPKHKFFIGSQFHPEFTSRPLKPNPLFDGFIKATIE
jgi:CTP synthase